MSKLLGFLAAIAMATMIYTFNAPVTGIVTGVYQDKIEVVCGKTTYTYPTEEEFAKGQEVSVKFLDYGGYDEKVLEVRSK